MPEDVRRRRTAWRQTKVPSPPLNLPQIISPPRCVICADDSEKHFPTFPQSSTHESRDLSSTDDTNTGPVIHMYTHCAGCAHNGDGIIQASNGHSAQVSSSVDLSTLAHVSEGYTAGSIGSAVKATLTPRRIYRMANRSLLSSEFLGVLAQQQQLLKKDVQARRKRGVICRGEGGRGSLYPPFDHHVVFCGFVKAVIKRRGAGTRSERFFHRSHQERDRVPFGDTGLAILGNRRKLAVKVAGKCRDNFSSACYALREWRKCNTKC